MSPSESELKHEVGHNMLPCRIGVRVGVGVGTNSTATTPSPTQHIPFRLLQALVPRIGEGRRLC